MYPSGVQCRDSNTCPLEHKPPHSHKIRAFLLKQIKLKHKHERLQIYIFSVCGKMPSHLRLTHFQSKKRNV